MNIAIFESSRKNAEFIAKSLITITTNKTILFFFISGLQSTNTDIVHDVELTKQQNRYIWMPFSVMP